MTIVESARPITGGVDTHADVHVAAAIDSTGGVLGVESFATTATGCTRLSAWLRVYAGIRAGTRDVERFEDDANRFWFDVIPADSTVEQEQTGAVSDFVGEPQVYIDFIDSAGVQWRRESHGPLQRLKSVTKS